MSEAKLCKDTADRVEGGEAELRKDTAFARIQQIGWRVAKRSCARGSEAELSKDTAFARIQQIGWRVAQQCCCARRQDTRWRVSAAELR